MRRAVAVGAVSASLGVALCVLLAMAYRCIDTPEYYEPRTLLWVGAGIGAVAAGAALIGGGRFRRGAAITFVGILLLAYGVVGPPYKSCGRFFLPM